MAKGFMQRLVRLVSTTSVPISIIEKQEFRELIWFLDEKIPIPGRIGLVNECLKYFKESKQEIMSKIENCDIISLGADIWSKRGLSESYLGITAYFYDKTREIKYVLTLGLKLFPHPHKAENIRDQIKSIIEEYGIRYEKIFRVITDNGSNMVKTFKIEWLDMNECDDIDIESDEDIDINEGIEEIDSNVDENEFDSEETDLNSGFKEIKINRIGCVIHILQCVITVCNKSSPYKEIIKSATDLIKKFRQSVKLAEKLKLKTGSVLPTITPTRWNSLYLQINNLINKKSEITKICSEESIDNLRLKEWEAIQEFVKLYKPFNDITNEMSKDIETTISKVCSSLLFLRHHLITFAEKGSKSGKTCALNLLKELDKRFDHFLNIKNEKFSDGLYIASTFLDPRYARILSEEQQNFAKSFIKDHFKQFGRSVSEVEQSVPVAQTSETLSPFESFMETEFSGIPEQAIDVMLDLDKQLLNWWHFISKTKLSYKLEPLDFWLKDTSTQNFKDLKNIALNILCTPSSTATVERVFSAAGNACIGRRNRLSEKRLEMIVFFKNNAKYLDSLSFLK
jgi:hypothetical protein